MAIVTDPDSLSQGTSSAETIAWTASSVRETTLTGTGLPAVASGEFFEIRSANTTGNNGLYKAKGTPTTSSVTCDKVTGVNPANDGAASATWLGTTGAATEKSVHIDTDTQTIYLFEQGNIGTVSLSSTGGVTMLALHSFLKEEWKDDATLPNHPFPMIGIDFDAGKWEFGTDPSGNFSDWVLADDDATYTINTKRLIRNAGWNENDADGNVLAKYLNVTTLGTFNETDDQAYYAFGDDPTDTSSTVDYVYTGQVNEPVKFYTDVTPADPTATGDDIEFTTNATITRGTGSFVTDGFKVGGQVTTIGATTAGNSGTFTITAVAATTLTVSGTPFTNTPEVFAATTRLAVDDSNVFNTFLRIRDANGKTFAQADLSSAGETSIVNKVIKFPLGNAIDNDISTADATVSTSSPWTEVRIRYLDATYTRDVDTPGTGRDFGIVIDVGTYSQANGVSNGTTTFTSASLSLGSGEQLTDYTGGDLIIHEGTDKGTHTISGTPVDSAGTLTITLSSALTGSESNLSFTVQRATPLSSTRTQIYEAVQYLLRQAADIDSTSNVVNGKTASALLRFNGADLYCGETAPVNPNSATDDGVIIEGFSSSDSTFLYFWDNGGTQRTFPFVAAGNINFNANLVSDSDPYYWMYYAYTKLTAATNIDMATVSGDTGDIQDNTGSTLPDLTVGDYIETSGFSNAVNNGLFIVTAENTVSKDYTVRKLNGDTLIAEVGASVNVYEHPFGTDGAIIVDDNSGANIEGAIGGATIGFDYNYDGNTQGGRGSTDDMKVYIVALGLETGQYVITSQQDLTRSTSLSYSVTSALERNYST